MPSFNWARLRPIAHSIASTIRHAQASAYQLHRDLETIREENRRYAAAHYGTAPHWDGYGPDGRRTGNGSGSGNGNRNRSGSRNGNRGGNSDRQRQRDHSFERAPPWMSRALYYAMPHLGGYETGRGFTWNAQWERWGGLVQARGGIPLEHKAADGRGTCVSLGVYVGMGNSERRDAAADPGRPDPDTGTDSESRLGYRRRRMGTMGYSYSCSRTNSSPKDAWHRWGGSDSDVVACPKSRVRRLGSRLFSSHSESW